MISEHYAERTSSCVFLVPNRHQKIFRRHLKALASRYRTSPSHFQTSLPCAYPCSSVAFLGITHPCLCISARLISLPGHASPSRFRAFPCNPYPTRRVHSHFRCCAALRFAPLSHCKSVRRLAVPCPCSATPCNSIPMHRPSTRRLSLAAPGHAIHCADASLRLALPSLTFAWLLASQLILCIPQQ